MKKMIKYFVQSPVEKQYIAKIEEELEESVYFINKNPNIQEHFTG